MRHLRIGIVLLCCFSTLAIGQQAGGGQTGGGAAGGGSAGGGTGGGGNTGGGVGGGGLNSPNTRTAPMPTQTMPQMEMPQVMFLSGKVMLDDGTPPTEPVTIERVCSGQPRPEGYTDAKGRFSFQLGQRNNGVLPDASTGNANDPFGDPFNATNSRIGQMNGRSSMGMRVNLMGCELRANLPGYQSSTIQLSNRNPLDNPDVGTIILKRLGNREGSVFSATNAFAPKDAKKALDKARDLMKKGKADDAQKELTKAVEIYPKYSSAWFELGKIQESKGNIEEARKSYAQSLAADPKYVYPYRNLFMLSLKEQKWEDVADTTARLIKLNPFDFPDALYYNAISNFNLKKFDDAEKSAKSLYETDQKRFARAGYILGLVMAQKEDYASAAAHLKKYLEAAPNSGDQDTVKKQLAEIEKFAGTTPQPQQQQQ